MRNLVILICIVLLSITACKNKPESKCPNGVNATVKDMKGLDGCSWVFVLEDETKLQPFNLDEFEFHFEDGQNIIFSYTEENAMAGICMVGPIVKVNCIDLAQ